MQSLLGSVTVRFSSMAPESWQGTSQKLGPFTLQQGCCKKATDLNMSGAETCTKKPRSVLAWAALASQTVAHPSHGVQHQTNQLIVSLALLVHDIQYTALKA